MNSRSQFREITLRSRSAAFAPVAPELRLPKFFGCNLDAKKILCALRVTIIGLGSVGGRVAAHLARFQVASLHLVDPKAFKPESLLTHEMSPADVGKSKAMQVARRCKRISPRTRVFAFIGGVADLALSDLARMSLVVLATDDLAPEVDAGWKCANVGKALIQGSVHGETLCAQVRVFGNASAQSPCPACIYNEMEWRLLYERAKFSCQGGPVPSSEFQVPSSTSPSSKLETRNPEPGTAPPTMSHSALCALAADLVLNQVLRAALKLGEPVEDTLLEYCGYTNRIVTSRLVRNPKCPVDHSIFELAFAPRELAECSLAELATTAGAQPSDPSLGFTIEGFVWANKLVCQCPTLRSVQRFVKSGRKEIGRCSKCNSPLQVQPFYSLRTVPMQTLGESAAVPLGKLGTHGARSVLVQTAERGVRLCNPIAE